MAPSLALVSRTRRIAATALGVALLIVGLAVQLGWLDGLDRAVDGGLPPRHALGGYGGLQLLATGLTSVLNPRLLVPVTLAVGVLLHRRGNPLALRSVLPPVLTMAGSVLVLKAALGRPGPPGSRPVDVLGWWPSGHTATAAVCLGVLAAVSGRYWPRWVAGIVATAVAGSMLIIHAHWLSDLVGAGLLGGLLLVVLLPCPGDLRWMDG